MAPLLLHFPIAAVIVAVVALSSADTAAARPCRTFLISSYSIRNPSTNTFATVTEVRSLTRSTTTSTINNPNPLVFNIPDDTVFSSSYNHNHKYKHKHIHKDLQRASLSRVPLGFYGYDFTSLRDRTKDILSVVLALLFGFGCGSLAAATMYLIWSVFSGRSSGDYRYEDFSDESSEEGAEIESPKKFGYVKIPPAEAAAAAPPAAKNASSV